MNSWNWRDDNDHWSREDEQEPSWTIPKWALIFAKLFIFIASINSESEWKDQVKIIFYIQPEINYHGNQDNNKLLWSIDKRFLYSFVLMGILLLGNLISFLGPSSFIA